MSILFRHVFCGSRNGGAQNERNDAQQERYVLGVFIFLGPQFRPQNQEVEAWLHQSDEIAQPSTAPGI